MSNNTFWCGPEGPCRSEGGSRQWMRKRRRPDRLRLQDKASCLATGTSFLSFCLHIVFAPFVFDPVRCSASALDTAPLFSTAQAPSPAMCGEGETVLPTPMQLLLRCSTTSVFLPCERVSTSNRRLMARNEDDFRIRPGKVGDRGGGRATARAIGAACGRPAGFVGEVHWAIRSAGGNPTGTPAMGREAADSMRGAGARQRR